MRKRKMDLRSAAKKPRMNCEPEADWRKEKPTVWDKLEYFMNSTGDVTFVIGENEEEVKANTFNLSALSPVFEAMFSENWKSQKSSILLPDIQSASIFRHFLKFMHTDDLKVESLDDLSMDEILHLLYIAKKYNVTHVESVCRDFIVDKQQVENVVSIFNAIQLLNEPEIERETFKFTTRNIEKLLKDSSFVNLSEESLKRIVQCENLMIDELTLFNGVYSWAEFQCSQRELECSGENIRSILGDMLFSLRLPLLSARNFAKFVCPKNILKKTEKIDLFCYMATDGESLDLTNFKFNVEKRGMRVLPVIKDSRDVPFPCVGDEREFGLKTNREIIVHSLSFLGPIAGDSNYEITFGCEEIEESATIFAREKTNWKLYLKNPLVIKPEKIYWFYYTIKGANTLSPIRFDTNTMTKVSQNQDDNEAGQSEISFQFNHPLRGPLSQLFYEIANSSPAE